MVKLALHMFMVGNEATTDVAVIKILENRNNEQKEDTLGDKENEEVKEEEKVADNFQENDENPVTSKQLDTFTTKDPMQVEMEKVQSEGKEGTKTSGQIAVTKTVGQIRKLMLLKEEHQAKRQKVHMKHDRLLEILKDSEQEKNEKKYYVIKLQGSFHNRGTKIPSNSRNKLKTHFVPYQTLAFASSEGDEVMIESKDRVTDCVYTNPLTPAASSHVSTPDQALLSTWFGQINSVFTRDPDLSDRPYEKSNSFDQQIVKRDFQSPADNHQTEHMVHLVEFLQSSNSPMITDGSIHRRSNISVSYLYDRTDQKLLAQIPLNEDKEGIGRTNLFLKHQHSNRNNEQKEDTLGDKEENEEVDEEDEVADNFQENDENPATSKELDTVTTRDPMQVEEKNAVAEKWIFTNHAPPATSRISFCNEDIFCLNKGEYQNNVIRSEYDSTFIRLYRNIIRNETCRMMTSIDMVVSEAESLFGVERTWIFFDLLDGELFHFGSAGPISNFLPNMAESAVRQHVTSFFEQACDMMNRLMTLLLGCPDGKILQQMPEPTFISLLRSFIVSSLSNNKTKRGQSDKGTQIIRLIMVAPGLFVVAVGEEIPEDILVRFMHGDETVMNRFVDARLEIKQASQMQDSRPSCTPYLPDNAKLFIYIPTENGSYWHKMDMLRDNRIRRHGK